MKQLLNFTKKSRQDLLGIVPNAGLLFDPFDKAVSRLKYKPDLFNFVLAAEPIAEIISPSFKKNWEDCCATRAQELLELDREKYWFAYSGGIDSTCMLSAILQYWPEKELRKIAIVLSHHSIEENPYFFDKHVAKLRLINSLRPISEMLLKSKALLITGELGDQLFGADILGPACQALGDEILQKDYRDFAPKIVDIYTGVQGSGKAIFEHFHPIVQESPFPIRNNHDFFWWINFSQKWQHVKFRNYEMTDWNLQARYGTHVVAFYDSLDFQRWSLNNHDLKIQKTWNSYKFTAKQFITDFTGDPGQMNLLKIQSLEKIYVLSTKRIGINSDCEEIKTVAELGAYVR
jgi:hypothetical protein